MKLALPFAKSASAASRERTLRAVAALGALLLAACGNNTTQVSAANAEGLVTAGKSALQAATLSDAEVV